MKWFRCIATAVVSASIFTGAYAHSENRNPLRAITTIEDAEIRTPGRRVHAHTTFDLTFRIEDTDEIVKLKLQPNNDVLAEGATVHKLGPDGEIREVEIIERSDHRIFKGSAFVQRLPGAEWTNIGWARIAVNKDGDKPSFEGAFRFDSDHHHIQTRRNYESTRLHEDPEVSDSREDVLIIWRDTDIIQDDISHAELKRSLAGESCQSDELEFNLSPDHPIYNGMMQKPSSPWDPLGLMKRFDDNIGEGNGAGVYLANSIGKTDGCFTSRRVALVGIATDCDYTASFATDEDARKNIITQMNLASQLYEETFQISLGIQNLTISDRKCPTTEQANAKWNRPCSAGLDINTQLNLFSAWRGERQDTNAYWTLLTKCVSGPAVGNAWLGQVCVNDATARGSSNETSTGANVVAKVSNEWLVIAHEVGHTFGAVHDCDATACGDGRLQAQQCCPLSTSSCPAGGKFVMNPSTGSGITKFSPCSIGNICSAIGRNAVRTNCLTDNKGVTLITGSQCGNGIVEAGEDCDCGGVDGCGDNKCCNPTTCKFATGSVCDPSNEDCCTPTCGFASNSTICRASTGACDLEEKCSGASAGCPEDKTQPDGQACGEKGLGLACASGQCTSQDDQCRSMMGIYSNAGNTTYACYNSGCMAMCASPELPPNTCYEMKQSYLDGTPCGGGGKCSNGVCAGSSVGGEIKNWVEKNKSLVIGLACGIGGLLIISILSCCISSCRRKRRIKHAKAAQAAAAASGWGRPPPPGPPRGRHGDGYSQVPVPPQMTQRDENGYAYGAGGQNYNGGYNAYPNNGGYGGPPPSYGAPPVVRYA